MRIAVLGTGTGERERLPPAIAALASPGIEPVLINTRIEVFAHTQADRALVDLGHLDAAIGAEREGFDALFVNTFADYGLAGMKSALSIPVVGAGEAALQLAPMLGERFVIITVWPRSLGHLYRERLRETRSEARCAGVIHVSPEAELARLGSDDGVMQRMARGEGEVVDRLVEASVEAIEHHRADTVVLGCTCMAPVAPALQTRLPAPVIESSRAGYLATESLLRLGLTQSRLAYARPGDASLERLRRVLDAQDVTRTDASGENSEACPVCLPDER